MMPNNSEQYRLECEVRHWKSEIKKKGWHFWEEKKKALLKKRGQAGLDYLVAGMNSN